MKLLKRYINYLSILVFLLLSKNALAITSKTECGKFIFSVVGYINEKEEALQYKLFYEQKNEKRNLAYRAEPSLVIEAACVK